MGEILFVLEVLPNEENRALWLHTHLNQTLDEEGLLLTLVDAHVQVIERQRERLHVLGNGVGGELAHDLHDGGLEHRNERVLHQHIEELEGAING